MRARRADRTTRAGGGALLLMLALAAACGPRDAEPSAPPPIAIRGGVVIEPPELAIGQTATIDVAVVTPPDHRLEPFEGPGSVEGLWILGVEQPPPERMSGRWVHHVRFRVRSRQTGDLVWPAGIAFVGTPRGERIPVSLAERPLRVAPVTGEIPERVDPFTYRTAREPSQSRGFLAPALFGAASLAAALALAGAVRRARAARAAREALALSAPDAGPEARAERALEAALGAVEHDAEAAAGAASAALRAWVAERSGAPAPAATTEELAALSPPFVVARAWPDLLAILVRLDLARFRAGALGDPAGRRELAATVHAARAVVASAAPVRSGA
jgi:hypothetical protein